MKSGILLLEGCWDWLVEVYSIPRLVIEKRQCYLVKTKDEIEGANKVLRNLLESID